MSRPGRCYNKELYIILCLALGLAACGEAATSTPAASQTPANPSSLTPGGAAGQTASAGLAQTVTANSAGRPAVPSAAGGQTMKEAYAIAEPAIRAWQADAVLLSIFNPPDTPVGLDPQGRAPQWFFEAYSPAAAKRSFWLVKSDEAGKFSATRTAEDELPPGRANLLESRKLPAITSLIDSDRLLQVARENGGTQSDRPLGIQLARSGVEGEPLAFDLVFYMGENVVRLRIDAQSGKLVENVKG